MPNPQNPELRRSEESLRPRPELGPDPQDVGGEGGPVPPDNQPGHHPPEEQDKPPADAFAEAMGIKPDTEQPESGGDQAPTRGRGRAATKATARKAAAKRATKRTARAERAPATGAAEAAPAAAGRGRRRKPAEPAAETPVSPVADEPVPSPTATTGTPAGTPTEPAEQAARQHHHALPDDQLPHDTGVVTPSGTPITTKVLTLPIRYWTTVFKVGGGAVTAYGRMVKRVGERIVSGRR